jgi:hypothetical protein
MESVGKKDADLHKLFQNKILTKRVAVTDRSIYASLLSFYVMKSNNF